MPSISRVGDTGVGVCVGHDTPVAYVIIKTSGSGDVAVEGSPVATIGSLGVCSCGHSGIATTGSSSVSANGSPVHRVGDTGVSTGGGSHTMNSGASTVFAGG